MNEEQKMKVLAVKSDLVTPISEVSRITHELSSYCIALLDENAKLKEELQTIKKDSAEI